MSSLLICTPQQIFRWSNREARDGRECSAYGRRRGVYRVLV